MNLKELSDVVNVNGYLIGLDKIGHFFPTNDSILA